MHQPLSIQLMAAGMLAAAAACGDAATTSPADANPSNPPADTPSAPSPGPGTIGITKLEIPVGRSVVLHGPLVSQSTGRVDDGRLAWRLRDPAIAQLHSSNWWTPTVDGNHAGSTELTITGATLQAKVQITVLDTAAARSPVVVDDFQLIEMQDEDGIIYVPQLVVRDTSGAGESAVIGIWFEMPAVGATTRCAMLRPIGSLPAEVFHSGDWGLFLPGWAGSLASEGPVIAHIDLRVPGPLAKEITVIAGRVAPGEWPPNRAGTNDDVLSCG